MIVLSNTTAQTIAAGQSITFNTIVLHTGNGECHRANTTSVKMKQFGIYEVSFSGNVASTTANDALQLNVQIGGETLPETTMLSTPATANVFNNVATKTEIKNCCCDYDRITITNTGTTSVVVGANPSFVVKRVS